MRYDIYIYISLDAKGLIDTGGAHSAGHEADNTPLCNDEFKNEWSQTFTSPLLHHGVYRNNSILQHRPSLWFNLVIVTTYEGENSFVTAFNFETF